MHAFVAKDALGGGEEGVIVVTALNLPFTHSTPTAPRSLQRGRANHDLSLTTTHPDTATPLKTFIHLLRGLQHPLPTPLTLNLHPRSPQQPLSSRITPPWHLKTLGAGLGGGLGEKGDVHNTYCIQQSVYFFFIFFKI